MDKMCLALYDVTGIQQFIFSSNRAKENIGASVYVRRILDGELRKILGSVGDKTADFEQQPDKLQITANNQLQSEIIYIGGGNAMVLYRNRDLAIAATRELARRILLDTRNTLGLAVAYVDTSLKNFCNDQRQLRLQIDKCKASQPRSEPLGGIAVTIECADGLPACGAKGKKAEFISNPANNKLENAKDNIFKHLIPDKREFPMEFDELGGEKGEQSQIAVVHIDGNGMGAFIKQAVESVAEKGYDSAVAAMRRLSKEIQAAYEQVFRDVCVELDNAMQSVDVRETIKSKKNFLPIRPLILSGDDTTFVCDGRIGLQLTARFLELLAQRKIDGTALSACAGIAITGSHFPFHRAYSLAEALCGNAKRHAKQENSANPGSWMDYHIVFSGFELDIDAIRSKAYSVPGMSPPKTVGKIKQYNLLLRPFPVAGVSTPWRWQDIVSLSEKIRNWPRSKHKALRNAFAVSVDEVVAVQRHNASRKNCLPSFQMTSGAELSGAASAEGLFHNNRTPYFEALEMMDFHVAELKLQKNKGA